VAIPPPKTVAADDAGCVDVVGGIEEPEEEPMGREERPHTGSRRTRSNRIPWEEMFCMRTSRWTSDRCCGSSEALAERLVWMRVLIDNGGFTWFCQLAKAGVHIEQPDGDGSGPKNLTLGSRGEVSSKG
jgi:hypothetical protein